MEYKTTLTQYITYTTSRTKHYAKKFYATLGSCVHKPYGTALLGLLFYIEAICFLPVDPILFVYCIEQKKRALWYAAIATAASVLGGITSYLIGTYLWNSIGTQIICHPFINYFISADQFLNIANRYQQYGFLTILIIGMTPFPYKAITLSAGFCSVPFIPFVLCSCLVRGIRFFGYAITILWVSKNFKQFSKRSIVGILAIILGITTSIWLIIKLKIVHY